MKKIVDWRAYADEHDADDELLERTPQDVVSVLGFDPLSELPVRASEAAVELVHAAGTSEGVRKSWEHRSRSAGDASTWAESRTKLALSNDPGEGNKGYHRTAAGYHEHAAMAHSAAKHEHTAAQKEIERADPDSTHDHVSRKHKEEAQFHKEREDFHQARAQKLSNSGLFVASSDSSDDETVRAKDIVHCREFGIPILAKARWEIGKPVTFQWMPSGVHTICATYNEKPIQLTVKCDAKTAPIVQASYESWRNGDPQDSFGCEEHKEGIAAVRFSPDVTRFEWKDDPKPGVFCTAVATEFGCRNVNGLNYRSWSPSFATDAEYHKAVEQDGMMVFPAKARGGKDNPARIIGVARDSAGSLTNKPAFREMLPVLAKESEAQASDPVVEEIVPRGTIQATAKAKAEAKPSLDDAIRASLKVSPLDAAISKAGPPSLDEAIRASLNLPLAGRQSPQTATNNAENNK